jgi:hypothetical protein
VSLLLSMNAMPFVVDGRSKLESDDRYVQWHQDQESQLRAELVQLHRQTILKSGWFRRLRLAWRIEREIEQRMQEQKPSCHTLFVTQH